MRLCIGALVVFTWMTVFGETIFIKSMGFFFEGFFHLKTTLCYTYLAELIPAKSKNFVLTLLTALDSSTLMVACCYFKYLNADF